MKEISKKYNTKNSSTPSLSFLCNKDINNGGSDQSSRALGGTLHFTVGDADDTDLSDTWLQVIARCVRTWGHLRHYVFIIVLCEGSLMLVVRRIKLECFVAPYVA